MKSQHSSRLWRRVSIIMRDMAQRDARQTQAISQRVALVRCCYSLFAYIEQRLDERILFDMKSVVRERKSILIFDDHPLVRMGMAYLINQEPDLFVQEETGDLMVALDSARRAAPDLLLLDATPRVGQGLSLINEFKRIAPQTPILAISAYGDTKYVERVIRQGARGFVIKRRADQLLIPAIRAALDGGVFLGEETREQFFRAMSAKRLPDETSPYEMLSVRELQVFEMIAQGRTTRLIAEQMAVSVKTVESYRARIKDKLGLENGAALTRKAVLWFGDVRRGERSAL